MNSLESIKDKLQSSEVNMNYLDPFFNEVEDNMESDVTPSDVNFYDYNGSRLYSCSRKEFLSLTTWPIDAPTHDGLTFEGWSGYTFANAKIRVEADYGLDLGANYITDDEATNLYVHFGDISSASTTYGFKFVNGVTGATSTWKVNWGDGSATETYTGNTTSSIYSELSNCVYHTYNKIGDYKISIITVSNSETSNTSYLTLPLTYGLTITGGTETIYCASIAPFITNIEIGRRVRVQDEAFKDLPNLQTISIPVDPDKFMVTNNCNNVFKNDTMLKAVCMPVYKSDSTTYYTFSYNTCFLDSTNPNIKAVIISRLPHASGYTFCSAANRLKTYDFKSTTTSNASQFTGNTGIESITIASGITTIGGGLFGGNSVTAKIRFIPTTPPTISSSSSVLTTRTGANKIILVPYNAYTTYEDATNYPDGTYVGYTTVEVGAAVPIATTGEYAWYASISDLLEGSLEKQITVGNGNEIYCTYTEE